MLPTALLPRLVFACTTCLSLTPAFAHDTPPLRDTETWLVLSGASHHFRQEERDWREVNPGLGFERTAHYRDIDELYYVGGYFKNSYDKHALYAGVRWMPLGWNWGPVALKVGGYALASTGYPSPVLVLPGFAIETEKVGLNVVVAPNIGNYSGYVGVQLRLRVD